MKRAVLVAFALAGCTALVTPPIPRDTDVEVLLVDEACHKGLVLPNEHGELVEWGFGHYGWYALEQNAWYHAPGTVLWPGAGTLSRRTWDAGERERRSGEDVVAFRAPRERALELARDLEHEFDAARGTLHHSVAYSTDFVRSTEHYWIFHDCHDATAEWLEALGCRVEPALVRIGLEFRAPRRLHD